MKIYIFLFLAFLCLLTSSVAQDVSYVLPVDTQVRYRQIYDESSVFAPQKVEGDTYLEDSVVSFVFDTLSSTWHKTSRIITNYNSNGKASIQIFDKWNNIVSFWYPSKKSQYYYDSVGICTGYILSIWAAQDSNWLLDKNIALSYDSVGNPAEVLTSRWDTTQQSWIPSSKTSSSFDAQGREILVYTYLWNKTTNVWRNVGKNTYLYQNGYLSYAEVYYWGNSTWNIYMKYEYVNDISGNPSEVLLSEWDILGSAWLKSSKETYAYSQAGNVTEYKSFIWDSVNTLWQNDFRAESEYDSHENYLKDSSYTWIDNKWVASTKNHHYYALFSPSPVLASLIAVPLVAYPNPTHAEVTIQGLPPYATLAVYDLNGRRLLTHPFFSGVALDLSSLAPGIYMIEICNEGIHQFVQVLKE